MVNMDNNFLLFIPRSKQSMHKKAIKSIYMIFFIDHLFICNEKH